ncbi:hypothetical protein [Candidatus Regiella endosymbiont of Tuberolachnus salignus]
MSNRQGRIRKRALRNKLLAAKRREKNKTWFTRLMCLFKQEKTHVIF